MTQLSRVGFIFVVSPVMLEDWWCQKLLPMAVPMVAVVSESYTSGIRVGGKVLHVCTQLPLTRHGWDGGGGHIGALKLT